MKYILKTFKMNEWGDEGICLFVLIVFHCGSNVNPGPVAHLQIHIHLFLYFMKFKFLHSRH